MNTSQADEGLHRFLGLHDQAGRAPLDEHDRRLYEDAKERLATAICDAQRIDIPPGTSARSLFRVLVLFYVELAIHGRVQKSATMEVWTGGFSTIISGAPPAGTEIPFRLRLPRHGMIEGWAVGSAIHRTSALVSNRACFDIVAWEGRDGTEPLEAALFDEVLLRFRR
jgi:hypothetical protein